MMFMAMMAPPAGSEGGSPFAPLIMMGLIFVIFYFLLIRPQQKQQKKQRAMIESVKKGDKVVTTGGLYGTVAGVHDDRLVLLIAKDVKVDVQKSAVSGVIGAEDSGKN